MRQIVDGVLVIIVGGGDGVALLTTQLIVPGYNDRPPSKCNNVPDYIT